MTNATLTITTKTGSKVTISSATDPRVSDVTGSDDVALVTARSSKARDELASEYAAWGCRVEAVDARGLSVW